MSAETFAASIRRAGRPMVLKRRQGTSAVFDEASISGKERGFQPNELVGGVIQGDRKIRICRLDLDAATQADDWPGGAPKKGDILDGGAVQGVQTLFDGADVVGYVIWCRG